MGFRFRNYQENIIEKGLKQCLNRKWCYLAMEVRTGKTLTALGIADRLGGAKKRVVFVTKKKAISSIENDVITLNSKSINVEVINYESLHKLDINVHVDIWIIDEAHRLGGFPKPSKATKQLKDLIHLHSSVIFLSGTPTPESNSQIFHQLYILGEKSPFSGHNFYQWAKINCNIKEQYFGHGYPVKDYSDCHYDINKLDLLTYSQKQAGFKNEINEHFVNIEMLPITKKIISTIKKDKIYKGKNDVILADTMVKEMQKIHQLSSGTCILEESGESIIIDESKAIFIKENFNDYKLAIFYKFKAELDLIKKHLDITTDINEFNNSDKHIALQFVSGREGIKLDKADMIIALNIDFSATTYFQFRDRMTTKERKQSDVYWLFSDCGIEKYVYKAVSNKKNYTKQYYERATISKKDNSKTGERGLLRDKANKNKQKRNPRPIGIEKQGNLFY